jgi:hypothetical protein
VSTQKGDFGVPVPVDAEVNQSTKKDVLLRP